MDKAKETIALLGQERSLRLHVYAQNRRIDFGRWIERARGHLRDNTRATIKLDAHRQHAQVARLGDDALRDLLLHHYDQQTRWIRALQKVAERRRGNIVWQVRHQLVRILGENLFRIEKEQIAR